MNKNTINLIFSLFAVCFSNLILSGDAQAELQVPPHLVRGHGGVSVPYIDGQWNLKVVDATSGSPIDYAVDEALFYLDGNTAVETDVIPSDFYPWLGTSTGQTIYVVPQDEVVVGSAFFGFNIKGMDETDKAALAAWEPSDTRVTGSEARIRIDLLSVTGLDGEPAPGEFSVWYTADESTTVWMSTAQTPSDGNTFYLDVEHGHSHVNWGFTAPGVYEVELQASTFLASDPNNMISSPVTTYHFGVLSSVPEPSTFAMLIGGCAAVFSLVRRKRSI